MKKVVAIIAVILIIFSIFAITTKIYAAEGTQGVIDEETEGQLIEIKDNQAKSLVVLL